MTLKSWECILPHHFFLSLQAQSLQVIHWRKNIIFQYTDIILLLKQWGWYFRTACVILNVFQSIKLIFPDSSGRWTDWFWPCKDLRQLREPSLKVSLAHNRLTKSSLKLTQQSCWCYCKWVETDIYFQNCKQLPDTRKRYTKEKQQCITELLPTEEARDGQ